MIGMTRDEARQAGRALLGQKVTRVLRATGVEQTVKTISRWLGVDCGCARRSRALDRWEARRRRGP